MNRAQLMVCLCALALCYVWFDFTTPRMTSNGHDYYSINSSVISIDLIVWSVVAVVAVLVYKATGKK